MADDRGFQPIRRPSREEEEQKLEALAAQKGVGRLQSPAPPAPVAAPQPEARPGPAASPPKPEAPGRRPDPAAKPPTRIPAPAARMRAMNLQLPDYVLRQLKERALREDCSVRHLIMRGLTAEGISIDPVDLVADGRRARAGAPGRAGGSE